MYDVYVAGPFFRQHQIESMERLESVLEKHGFKMFQPRFDSVDLSKDKSAEARNKAFRDDVEAIGDSTFLIANTLDKDMGTLFEVGYAYRAGVPIVGFVEGLPKGAPFNIMLAGAMEWVYTTPEDLDSAIAEHGGKSGFIDWVLNAKKPNYEGNVE